MGRIIAYIMENKKCLKPPLRYIYITYITNNHHSPRAPRAVLDSLALVLDPHPRPRSGELG